MINIGDNVKAIKSEKEEAEIAAEITPIAISAPDLAEKRLEPLEEITPLLESMADKVLPYYAQDFVRKNQVHIDETLVKKEQKTKGRLSLLSVI